MENRPNPWLNAILRLSSKIFHKKKQLISASPLQSVFLAFQILLLEAWLTLLSLPSSIFISQNLLGKNSDTPIGQSFILRRTVSVSVFIGVIVLWALQGAIGLAIALFLPTTSRAFAAEAGWDFNVAEDYVFDTNRFQITEGSALFRGVPLEGEGSEACTGTLSPLLPLSLPADTEAFSSLTVVQDVTGGTILYALSTDAGTTWNFWDGGAWVLDPSGTQGSSSADIQTNISSLPVGANGLLFRALFTNSCTGPMTIFSITLSYTQTAPPAEEPPGETPPAENPVVQNAIEQQASNAAPEIQVDAVTTEASGKVLINYSLIDADEDFLTFDSATYSTTGFFSGEERLLFSDVSDARDNGMNVLSAALTPTPHVFIWNAPGAIPLEDTPIYFRLAMTDGINRGPSAVFGPYQLTLTPPEVTNLTALQVPGSDDLAITFTLVPPPGRLATVALEVSADDGATWTILSQNAEGLGVTWNASGDFPNTEGTLTLRATATDTLGNTSSSTTEVSIDTRAPTALGAVHAEPSTNTVVISWDNESSDSSFATYEVTVEDALTGTRTTWDTSEVSTLSNPLTTSLLVSGLNAETTYTFFVKATDAFGHTSEELSVSRQTTGTLSLPPLIAPVMNALPATVMGPTFLISGTAYPGSRILITSNSAEIGSGITGNNGVFEISVSALSGVRSFSALAEYPDGRSIMSQMSRTTTVENGLEPPAPAVNTSENTSDGGGITPSPLEETPVVLIPADKTAENPETLPAQTEAIPEVQIVGDTESPTTLTETTPSETRPPSSENTAGTSGSASSPQPINQLPLAAVTHIDSVETVTTARLSPLLPEPTIIASEPSLSGDVFQLSGTALPNERIAVVINSEELLYTVTADPVGNWEIEHIQNDNALPEGEHTAYAIALDEGSNTRSKPSSVITFHVSENTLTTIAQRINIPTTILVFIAALIALIVIYTAAKKRREAGLAK